MLKKCKLVMLPSNQKAPIILGENLLVNIPGQLRGTGYHLYFLSDNEIKEGDWIYNKEREPSILQCIGKGSLRNWKKIIATTDESLKIEIFGLGETAMCSLPQPSQSFLEIFVKEYNKGMVIKEVMIEYYVITLNEDWSQKPVVITNEYKLKINSKDNTITIKRVKDSWNREEVIALFKKYIEDKENSITSKYNGFDNWIEQNL